MMQEFNPREVNAVNEMIKFNNEFVGLMKQMNQYENTIKNLRRTIKRARQGLGFPLMKAIGQNIFETIPLKDKKEVLAEMMKQMNILENSLKGISGQIEHKRDEYEGGCLKVFQFLRDRFKEYEEDLITDPKHSPALEMPSLGEDDA